MNKQDIKMFNDIQELEIDVFENAKRENIDHYSDKYLKNLEYQEFYGALYELSNDKIILYAYVFNDTENACRYFENVTGKNNFPDDTTFLKSFGMLGGNMIVMENNKVYYIEAKKRKNFEHFVDVLNEKLSVSIYSYE